MVRKDAEERRDRMRYLEQEAEKLKAEYEETLARLKAAEDHANAEIGLRIHKRLEDTYAEARDLTEDLRYSASSVVKKRLHRLRDGLGRCLKDIESLLADHKLDRPLEQGDDVYVIKVHKWGTVERVDARHGRARVRVGNIQMDVPLAELQAWGETGS
jgi:dsDNA-specific endonuclease/ATPase MutS2